MLEGPDIGVHRMQTDLAELEAQVEDMEITVHSNQKSCMHTSKSVEDLASQFAQMKTQTTTMEQERWDSMHEMIVANESSTQCLVKLVNALQSQLLRMQDRLQHVEKVTGVVGVVQSLPPPSSSNRTILPNKV